MTPNRKDHVAKILGLGFDNEDGHVRITRGDGFEIYLGSKASHEDMQNVCMRIQERLDHMGRKLEDLSREEFAALVSGLEKS